MLILPFCNFGPKCLNVYLTNIRTLLNKITDKETGDLFLIEPFSVVVQPSRGP